jgi:hypothetical protein
MLNLPPSTKISLCFALCGETGATFVACGAHARRYFIKAQPNNKKECDKILQMFAELFEIERSARALGLSVQEVSLIRQQEALPVLTGMTTCKRHGINLAEYIKDVLERLTVYPGAQIDSLLPNNWQRGEQKFDFKAWHITPKLALR